jgi:hypothetical protein
MAVVNELDAALAAVHDLENRALDDSAADRSGALEPLVRRAERALLDAFLALREPRDHAWLELAELDGGRALPPYLDSFARHAERLELSAVAHFERSADDRRDDWPNDRRWGPPASLSEALQRAGQANRPPLRLLLRVRGPRAAALVVEQGLHRYHGLGADPDPAAFDVAIVALRSSLTDAEWEALAPTPVGNERKKATPVRRVRGPQLELPARIALTVPDYDPFAAFEELALRCLVAATDDGVVDELFASRLAGVLEAVRRVLLLTGREAAVRLYRELTGVSVASAHAAIAALEAR